VLACHRPLAVGKRLNKGILLLLLLLLLVVVVIVVVVVVVQEKIIRNEIRINTNM
jgi:hypothetical protein